MSAAKYIFQRLRPGIAHLSTIAKVAPIPFTDQRHDQTPLEAKPFEVFPHVIPPRMLSVIRDQGPCDL
jgi:hypothetical protein